MQEDTQGYIKLHRKFLQSRVRRLRPSVVCTFIDLLLLAHFKTGEIETSYRELMQLLTMHDNKSIKTALESLENAGAIKVQTQPNLHIKICNWKRYQSTQKPMQKAVDNLLKNVGSFPTPVGSLPTPGVGSLPKKCREFSYTPHNKVPVSMDVFKNKEHFLKEPKNVQFLNLIQPQTDLEKLALFFAKGVKHPALKKPNANEVLNAALKNDLPHLQTVLDSAEDLEQAQKIVARFVKNSRGHYALYYLAQQVHSYRQELESEERR